MSRLEDLERTVRRLENMQGINGVMVHSDEGGITVALVDRPYEPELLPDATSPFAMFAVRCWMDDGEQGDKTTQATWTYKVRTMDATAHDTDGTVLGTGKAPECRTQATDWRGALDYPPAFTGAGWIGLGYYDADDVFHLWDAGERPHTTGCP